ncbi:MAG: tRNA 2-thiouridine(34) synthase MnmA [Acidimicrobiales bacterium]
MKVLVAMSGGVDSSVAAALASQAGNEVVGVTLKLWGGDSDSGCCSVADVEDARRVADQLGIAHHVFNFVEEFEDRVVGPYVQEHADGRTPNPCIECNRRVKFGLLLERAVRLGFDALATGHHARIEESGEARRLMRGADPAKDQSYVLAMLTRSQLDRLMFPVGAMTKSRVRELASSLGLRTAEKPDSQDVCFIHSAKGRDGFLASRLPLHRGALVDADSQRVLGTVPAVELVTPGQRRGLGSTGEGRRLYALEVDVAGRRILVGGADAATTRRVEIEAATWFDRPLAVGRPALAQTSAHGRAALCRYLDGSIVYDEPQRLVAPGQTVALYDVREPDAVVGSAVAA